ncbi:MAG: hypothetical protein KGZ75_12710 [Syntrophomonadaceae bacterium]|nr:hypothetical protein [Syntrophomonadaceae bacterium]
MEKVNLSQCWPDIFYFGPIWGKDGGNCTEIFIKGNNRLVDRRRTKGVLSALARLFARDLVYLRDSSRREANRSHSLPLVLDPAMVLVPVKARTASIKDEGTTGYLVLNKLERVEPLDKEGSNSRLIFQDGLEVTTLLSTATVRQRILEAKSLSKPGWSETKVHEPSPERVYYVVRVAEASRGNLGLWRGACSRRPGS